MLSIGSYVEFGKTCENNNGTLTFSKIKVYDEDINLSGKSFEDFFTLIPNAFNDTTLRKEVIDAIELDHIVYLIKSGVIKVELPNAYVRWKTVQKDSYCIDYRKGEEPRFWTILPGEGTSSNNTFGKIMIATLLSCFFMLLVLIVYALLPELQNLCGLILMAYVFSLFMAFLLLSFLRIPIIPHDCCLLMAGGFCFFFLAAFCWMSVMSYDMWWTFRRIMKCLHRKGDRLKFLMYCLYAWGVPLLMTIGLVVVNIHKKEMKQLPWFITPGIPEKGCFMTGWHAGCFTNPFLLLLSLQVHPKVVCKR